MVAVSAQSGLPIPNANVRIQVGSGNEVQAPVVANDEGRTEPFEVPCDETIYNQVWKEGFFDNSRVWSEDKVGCCTINFILALFTQTGICGQ